MRRFEQNHISEKKNPFILMGLNLNGILVGVILWACCKKTALWIKIYNIYIYFCNLGTAGNVNPGALVQGPTSHSTPLKSCNVTRRGIEPWPSSWPTCTLTNLPTTGWVDL